MDYVIIKDVGGNVLIFTHGQGPDDTNPEFVAQGASSSEPYELLIEKLGLKNRNIRLKTGGVDVSGVTDDATLATYLASNDYDEDYVLFQDRA
jgi:hypothetical protein